MLDYYSVAVKLKLTDAVTAGLAIVGQGLRNTKREADGVQASLLGIEQRMRSIKSLGMLGGAFAGAGALGLGLFAAPIKAAREYELAFTKFKTMNLGAVVNAQADQFARGANLMGISAKELMGVMSESVGLFGSYAEAQRLAPKIAALNSANSAIFAGKIGAIDEGASRSLMKFIDRRGGTLDDASFMRNLDLAQKMVTGSGGFIKFRDLDQFSQQGGTAFRGLSDAGILNMALLLQEQGGSRAGTSWMSLYQNLIAGRTPKKTMAMLQAFGLGHLAYQTHATVGGHALKSLIMKDIKGGDLLQANPPEWFRTVFLPALASKGVTSEAGILKATNDLLSNRTGSSQGSIMSTQLVQVLRDANLAKNAMGYDATINAWKDDPNSKFADLSARWTDVMRELGLVVLPVAIRGLESLTGLLQRVGTFAREFQTLTKGIVLAGGAIAGLAAVGGTLMLATAGFRALNLALGAGALAGGAGLLGSVTALLGPIGLLTAGLGALVLLANALKPGSKDDPHPGMHWVPGRGRGGTGGHWDSNERFVGARTGDAHWEDWDSGQSRYVARPAGGAPIVLNATIKMPDGKVLAKVVADEVGRAANAPQTGPAAFDGRANLTPAGGLR